MDALGFVLIVAGLAMLAEQVLTLLGGIFVASAIAGKVSEATANWWFGRVGILLTVAGFLVSRFVN